jgi:hypothetical protein
MEQDCPPIKMRAMFGTERNLMKSRANFAIFVAPNFFSKIEKKSPYRRAKVGLFFCCFCQF